MVNRPVSPQRLYRSLRDQLGSIRGVYLRSNRIVRSDELSPDRQNVLLLHGFFQTRNVWEIMEDRLRYDGFRVFSFDLGGLLWHFNTRSIATLSGLIADKLEALCTHHGIEKFHIIGHSKGGLVARHYIQHHGGDQRVRSLITLGTPHTGTLTAAIGVGLMLGGLLSRSPLEMLPRSRLIRGLDDTQWPEKVPLVSIYSAHDMVCPARSARLHPSPHQEAMRNEVVRGIGHTALTHDPGVYMLVRRHLEAASLS
jgi:triacylglycerol lipase